MRSASGAPLVAAVLGNTVLGALMTLGIGLYAPCMAMISLLGMNPTTAFPIMMGSCAFLMPVASIRFFEARRYDRTAATLWRDARRETGPVPSPSPPIADLR